MREKLVARLADLAAARQTLHYGALAQSLALTGPGTIARLTAALEALMEEDAALGRPFRAALVTSRGSALPARGFFDKAQALGADISDPAALVADHRRRLFETA